MMRPTSRPKPASTLIVSPHISAGAASAAATYTEGNHVVDYDAIQPPAMGGAEAFPYMAVVPISTLDTVVFLKSFHFTPARTRCATFIAMLHPC